MAEERPINERLDPLLDESLVRQYLPPDDMTPLSVVVERAAEADASDRVTPAEAPASRRVTPWRLALYAVAASVAWLFVAGQLLVTDDRVEIAFRERPLAEVYEECVAEGFKPYWVCDDDLLFGATFERRQGVALQLGELPAGEEMVGLSYLAGISRKSTSFLGLADDVPVVVFIDRLDRDWKPPVGEFPDAGVNVKRFERFGLVFYEVSPLDRAVFVNHFTVQDANASPVSEVDREVVADGRDPSDRE